MKKKAMVCMPTGGMDRAEAIERFWALKALVELGGEYAVMETTPLLDDDQPEGFGFKNAPLHYLGEALSCMAMCDAVFFADGWESERGCKVERIAAESYGLEVLDVRGD